MEYRSANLLCFCIVVMQLVHQSLCLSPADPESRARMEAQAMSNLSLKDLEEMVERDERVRNVQKPPLIIIPKPKNLATDSDSHYNSKAYIIHKKPKKAVLKKQGYLEPEFKYENREKMLPYEPPQYKFEGIKYDDDVPAWFDSPELESAESNPSFGFYESIAERILDNQKARFGMEDPFAGLDFAGSDDVPYYKPRFDYDSYSKDSTETKLKGKSYWRDAPERREEKIDDKGCRMVVKKIMDPEDEKKSGSAAAPKSVIITKECEYPSIEGPDAKIPDVQHNFRSGSSRLDSEPSTGHDSYEREPEPEYDDKSSETDKAHARKPLEPDYIDRMLETHFKSFPTLSNPITSFQGYQDRFNLRTPQRFREIKPTVGFQSYEYSSPKSGFETDRGSSSSSSSSKEDDAPRTYDHHYHYEYPEKNSKKDESRFDDDSTSDAKSSGKKDPKMVKKTFAYYRKDNPKDDPNDHQYAEEYAQGNYRSFSTDYDSERDGPKKQ